MKTIWKGAVSFGLVTIPVRVFKATEEKTLRFNQLHAEDGGRIRYKRFCSTCGAEVSFDEIVRGYEIEKDRYVTFTDDELERGVSSGRAIEILRFVPLEDIDPIYWQAAYYIVPESVGAKAYALLRRAMEDDRRVAVATVAFRDKEHLATLRIRDGVFVLETMFWPDEIRAAEFEEVGEDTEVREEELRMARTLIESMAGPFEPGGYRDTYRERLEEAVSRKLEGEEVAVVGEPQEAKVVDLMEALKASVEAAKRGSDAEEPEEVRRASDG